MFIHFLFHWALKFLAVIRIFHSQSFFNKVESWCVLCVDRSLYSGRERSGFLSLSLFLLSRIIPSPLNPLTLFYFFFLYNTLPAFRIYLLNCLSVFPHCDELHDGRDLICLTHHLYTQYHEYTGAWSIADTQYLLILLDIAVTSWLPNTLWDAI